MKGAPEGAHLGKVVMLKKFQASSFLLEMFGQALVQGSFTHWLEK